MIGRLRRKFIVACMISLAIVLTVILGGVNLMSYHKVVADADNILTLLDANNGALAELEADGTLQSIVDQYITAE